MAEGRSAPLDFLTNENKSLREELRRIDEREQFYKEEKKYYKDEMEDTQQNATSVTEGWPTSHQSGATKFDFINNLNLNNNLNLTSC